MDDDTASRFISSLVKSIQTFCNGYVSFSSTIEVIGHIHLNIDHSAKFNYVLTEEVSKSVSEGSTVFESSSYHSHPPTAIVLGHTSQSAAVNPGSGQEPGADPLCLPSAVSSVQRQASPSHAVTESALSDSVDASQDSISSASTIIDFEHAGTGMNSDNSRRRRQRPSRSSTETGTPESKRQCMDNAALEPVVQSPVFGMIEMIKKEPADSDLYPGTNTTQVKSGLQIPDFSNMMMDSLNQVDQVEGTPMMAGGSTEQGQTQQSPFPVMLHANPAAVVGVSLPAPSPVSPASIPGPSAIAASLQTPANLRKPFYERMVSLLEEQKEDLARENLALPWNQTTGTAHKLSTSCQRQQGELALPRNRVTGAAHQLSTSCQRQRGAWVGGLPQTFSWPLHSHEDAERLNQLLAEEEEQRMNMVSYWAGRGGRTMKHLMRNILGSLVSTPLARQYNFCGLKGKKALRDLHSVVRTIYEAVRRQFDATEWDMRCVIAAWLSGSRDRDNGWRERRDIQGDMDIEQC